MGVHKKHTNKPQYTFEYHLHLRHIDYLKARELLKSLKGPSINDTTVCHQGFELAEK